MTTYSGPSQKYALLDSDHAMLTIGDVVIDLTPYEACAVLVLQRQRGKYVRHDQLAERMLTARQELGFKVDSSFPPPDAKWQIGNLRRKLQQAGIDSNEVIARKSGWGYAWKAGGNGTQG